MAAHSENSIKIHTASCKGKLALSINDKGPLGKFELFTCTLGDKCGSATKPGESYVGRGRRLSDEDAEKAVAALAKAKEDKAKYEAKAAQLARDKAAKAKSSSKKTK